ncbi:hypothetical protein [Psychrobacter sp. 4Dc]|nr:hypothetical protein [Psychrobacter sp. 4Dc]
MIESIFAAIFTITNESEGTLVESQLALAHSVVQKTHPSDRILFF